jgi:hypothetical protein
VDLAGFDQGRDAFSFETNRHVAGYDRDAFVHMGFCHPGQDPKDDRRFRTHLSSIVTKLVDRVITIPVLKDHRSGGVTLALKNLSTHEQRLAQPPGRSGAWRQDRPRAAERAEPVQHVHSDGGGAGETRPEGRPASWTA